MMSKSLTETINMGSIRVVFGYIIPLWTGLYCSITEKKGPLPATALKLGKIPNQNQPTNIPTHNSYKNLMGLSDGYEETNR